MRALELAAHEPRGLIGGGEVEIETRGIVEQGTKGGDRERSGDLNGDVDEVSAGLERARVGGGVADARGAGLPWRRDEGQGQKTGLTIAAAKAATAATEADHAELRALMRQMAGAVRRGDMVADSRVSDLMHAKIREIGGQGTANRILERLRYTDVRYQFHVSLLPGRLVKGANEHYDIIEAVIAGDPVAAGQITRDHFMSVIGALRQLEEAKAQRPGIAL